MLATGQTTPFLEYLDAYLEDSKVEQKTKQMKRKQIMDYAAVAHLSLMPRMTPFVCLYDTIQGPRLSKQDHKAAPIVTSGLL